MGRTPRRCVKEKVYNRKSWNVKEDMILSEYVQIHGEGRWTSVPLETGLQRSGKSCRLRWFNYLRPNIKLGNISADEKDAIVRLQRLLGNRWSLIAKRLPGRTDNEIKNYWNTWLKKDINSASAVQSPPLEAEMHNQDAAVDPNLNEKPLEETTNTLSPVAEAAVDDPITAITSYDGRSSADQSYINPENIMPDDDGYYCSGVMMTPVHCHDVFSILNPVIEYKLNEWGTNSSEADNMNDVDYVPPLFSDYYATVQEEFCPLLFN